MNLYVCQIDLQNDARALSFANAVQGWMNTLKQAGVIGEWQLYRRKLGLASGGQRDFLLQVEVADLAQLDQAFRFAGQHDEDVETLYRAVHTQIGGSDVALYRPFPDPERAERMALI